MSDSIRIQLLAHREKVAPDNPFSVEVTGATLLYHQWRTYHALQTHALVVNTYNTGTGKTRGALLHLLDPKARGVNMLFIAPTNELIAQHARDIQSFTQRAQLDYHIVHVDAASLRALSTPHEHERVGERLNRLFQNPQEYGWDGRKSLAVVTNPDIFYYGLYFSAYNPHDRRNLFEQFVTRFDYVVIDEFHYYNPKQLATFLFYFVLCREWGYFESGRKICLLSATPEPEVLTYLQRIFTTNEIALVSPRNEPSESESLASTPALASTTLEIRQSSLDEYVDISQAQLCEWVLKDKLDGALISSALWRINVAHAALKSSLGEQMARITGAEQIAQRRVAPKYPLILATPTVDIGYNFDKPDKTRQPLDFVVFDARSRDQFLQRLGRAGRVLGRTQTDVPSRAIGLLNVGDDGWVVLKALDGQTLARHSFSDAIQNAIPSRRDLYSYMQSYAVIEALRPMFNLKQMLRPDLLEWLEKLFDSVCAVLAPDNPRWRFGSIEGEMRRFDKLERIVRRKEDNAKLLGEFLQPYLDWQKLSVSSKEFAHLANGLGGGRVRDEVLNWVEAQYWLMESLFSFRETLETPAVCVFDPKHLLAESNVTVYDALHVAMNYEVEWFADDDDFATKTQQKPEKALVYGRLRDHRSTRLRIKFEYSAPDRLDRERFEQICCRRPIVLKGLRLRAELADGTGTFPLEPNVHHIYEDTFVPLLALREGTLESGILRSRLRDTNIFLRSLKVFFADGTESDYVGVIGSAAFFVHAEMEKFLWMQERKEDNRPIIT